MDGARNGIILVRGVPRWLLSSTHLKEYRPLAGFKVPRYVRIVHDFESIGMTASSKVKRKELTAYAIKVLGLDEKSTAK